MKTPIYNLLKYSILLCVMLLVATGLGLSQDCEVLAHVVTNVDAGEGALVRMEKNTSTKFTQLLALNGNVGFFYGDDCYISVCNNPDEQTVMYSVVDTRSLAKNDYEMAGADYMQPVSSVYHPTDSVLYINYYDTATEAYRWGALRFDADAGQNHFELCSSVNCSVAKPYFATCATAQGEVYGFGQDAWLYRIDRATGEGEKLFRTGAVGTAQQSAWCDDESGVIYRAVPSSIGVTIYSYSIDNQNETFVKIYTSVAAIVAMAPQPEGVVSNLPAAVKNLSVLLGQDLLSGTISFTAPSTDINGNELVGDLSLVISVDNVVVDTLVAQPDEHCTYDYLFDNGNHMVSVFAMNENGKSETKEFHFFAGYDNPKPLSSVVVSCHFPYVDVSWDVPEGEHGQMIDWSGLRFRVTRYPDGVLVADTLAAQVTDTLPHIAGTYYYGVAVCQPNYTTSETFSDPFYYDCSIALPYVLNEWSDDIIESFVIDDANHDGSTWGCMETASGAMAMRYLYNSFNAADDYLYLAKMQLEEDVFYEATVYAHAGSEKYEEHFSVGVALSDDLSQRQEFVTGERCATKQSQPYKYGFAVPHSGDYRLYIHCISPANHHLLYIDSVSVVVSEQRAVPMAVSDMTLSPHAVNPHLVTIDITAPAHSADGAILDELTAISIYRNGGLIHTFEQPAVGATFTYCDSVGEVDNYTYTVVASNSYGAGAEVSQSIVRGVASFPYKHDFADGQGFFTLCDNNADGTTWHYYEDRFLGCMRYLSSETHDADDWIITPAIYLSDSIRYQLEYSCCVGLSIYPERLRVLSGITPQPNAMSMVIDELRDFTFIGDTCIVVPFDIPAAGNYYFAFHAASPADSYAIYLRNMAINEYDPMSVASTSMAQCRVWSGNQSIMVQSESSAHVVIYDITGTVITNFTATSQVSGCHVPAGIYLVQCGSEVRKVVVR